MYHRLFTSGAAVAVLALAPVMAPAPAAAQESWSFALEEIEGSVQDRYAQRFAELVAERSGGEVTVQVYPYGALGTSADLTELTSNGTLQFTFASPGHLATMVPAMGVFNLPYILSRNDEVNKRVLHEGETVNQLLADELRERNLELVTMFPEGEMVWTANREIRSPEDFSGFKMRTMVSPILTEAYQAMGASPTPMPYGEVYGGLQLGQIDGQVNPIFAIEEMGFYEVQDYLIFAGQQEFTTSVVAHQPFYEGLSDERRQMVESITDELADYIFEVKREFEEERLAEIQERKPDIQIIRLNEEERERFREASMPARDAFVERLSGDIGGEVLDSLTSEIAALEEELGAEPDEPATAEAPAEEPAEEPTE